MNRKNLDRPQSSWSCFAKVVPDKLRTGPLSLKQGVEYISSSTCEEAKKTYVMQPRAIHGFGRGLGMAKPFCRLWSADEGAYSSAKDDYVIELVI